jgi:hypothetical protein
VRRYRYAARALQVAAFWLIAIVSFITLGNYYTDPAYARDNYRAIAEHVEATARPGDSILLNAPGQLEVFGYYYDGPLPIYPLPERRPLVPTATEAALQQLVQPGGRVFAILWATDESDPERVIEGWLDTHAYKATDSWYGNVRLATFAVPAETPSTPEPVVNTLLRSQGASPEKDEIELVGYRLLNEALRAGDIAQITFFWRADETPQTRYKVFVHVLDDNNHIVGQRDAEPGGGARLTTQWAPGETIADNYGVLIHPATPPGDYRVEVGMYDLENGQRLNTAAGEQQIWLEPLSIDRPAAPWPASAVGMQHKVEVNLGEVTLAGYDAYRLGFDHQRDAPLHPGDVLHTSLYWRAEEEPSGDWRVRISLLDAQGRKRGEVTASLVPGFPTSFWRTGDLWRGQFHLPVPGDAVPGRYQLQIETQTPSGNWLSPVPSEALRVEP